MITASSPKVGYAYASGGNFSRLFSVTYPNGRVLNYLYNSGIDTNISRVNALSDAFRMSRKSSDF